MDSDYLESIVLSKRKRGVTGSMVEQTCLSAISSLGLHHGQIQWKAIDATVFEGQLPDRLPSITKNGRLFLVPDDPYFKDIDALYLDVDYDAKHIFVAPIQITISRTDVHSPSDVQFYQHWGTWEKHFTRFTLETTFVWIAEDVPAWEKKDAQYRDMRSGRKMISPKYDSVTILAEFLNESALQPQMYPATCS
jgi:hypothetical protein